MFYQFSIFHMVNPWHIYFPKIINIRPLFYSISRKPTLRIAKFEGIAYIIWWTGSFIPILSLRSISRYVWNTRETGDINDSTETKTSSWCKVLKVEKLLPTREWQHHQLHGVQRPQFQPQWVAFHFEGCHL